MSCVYVSKHPFAVTSTWDIEDWGQATCEKQVVCAVKRWETIQSELISHQLQDRSKKRIATSKLLSCQTDRRVFIEDKLQRELVQSRTLGHTDIGR